MNGSTFEVKFDTDNDAFDLEGAEVARILQDIAWKVQRGHRDGVVWDENGNNVGDWMWVAGEEE